MWDKFAVGPYGGYLQIVQPDDTLRPDDAHIVVVGLHADVRLERRRRDRAGPRWRRHPRLARQVPEQPEDKDGFQDQDGCPDPDNDEDGILDVEDACPNKPEDKRTAIRRPTAARSAIATSDGILDDDDKCPDEPEDKDGFEDEDGCPDPDNDKDGIPDTDDKCPNEPETVNGYADDDGCPDELRCAWWATRFCSMTACTSTPTATSCSRQPTAHLARRGHHRQAPRVHARRGRRVCRRARRGVVQPEALREPRQGGAHALGEVTVSRASGSPRSGYGTSNPRVPEKSDGAYHQNRRVEFKITRENRDVVHSDTVPDTLAPAPVTPGTKKEGESR